MFSLLQSIFGGVADTASAKYDARLIDRAIERIIDGTDPRLRVLSSYRKKLAPVVEQALDYVVELADSLPAPIELSAAQFGADDRIRGLFVSREHVLEVLGKSRVLREFIDHHKVGGGEYLYALLGAERKERRVLGMDMQGDIIRRDVMQEVVSFSNHRFVCPADSQAENSLEGKKRILDHLIERALQQIVSDRYQAEETGRQRSLLQRKLRTMEAAGLGIDATARYDSGETVNMEELQDQIAELEAGLAGTDVAPLTLDHYLEVIIETLSAPEHRLKIAPISLRISPMGIKLDEKDSGATISLRLNELSFTDNRRVVVLPVCIPRSEVPERKDFLKEAGRYL